MNEQTAHIGVAFPQLSEEQHDTLKDFLRQIGGQTATVERAPAPLEAQVLTGPVEAEAAQPPPPLLSPQPTLLRRGSRREQAIWQFEQGVLLYHQRKLGQATRAFQKVIREYADIIDVARVARRYHNWCHNEAETYGTQ